MNSRSDCVLPKPIDMEPCTDENKHNDYYHLHTTVCPTEPHSFRLSFVYLHLVMTMVLMGSVHGNGPQAYSRKDEMDGQIK